jgi:ribosome assembly protein RRB1
VKSNESSNDEAGEFEDEFEDEFDSEDEIFEAGVDGRPDAEREADESRGMWLTWVALCDLRWNLKSSENLADPL